ncbi:hypothetical protein G3I01_14765 [Gramella sp. MT6]|uniref:hypothetical protein n=1 Tax=Gramella sp. MT6 TaxID=2705471 RepID=UPI001C5D877C|nr:hypothetical protein [Gramella sp. MT6]QYA26700.1 hypothetical protein G3I01_14765 [Gramella sp. MT6]
MKSNHFNICPTCIHKNSCVLTSQKSKVWSCSEYEENIRDPTSSINSSRVLIQ